MTKSIEEQVRAIIKAIYGKNDLYSSLDNAQAMNALVALIESQRKEAVREVLQLIENTSAVDSSQPGGMGSVTRRRFDELLAEYGKEKG